MNTSANALILIIEDDAKMRRYLRRLLESDGHEVVEANTGQEGLERAAKRGPDLILLDVGLPDIAGRKVVDRVREWTDTPVLVVSGRDSEESKVKILDAGADDYVTKPFGADEFLARVRVGLRHAQKLTGPDDDAVFINGNLRVDRVARRVYLGDEEVDLTPTEYSLLLTLIDNAGCVMTHQQILEEVWGPECVGRDHYVRVYMAHLRSKIEEDPARPRHILTETGVGYRLRDI